MKIDAWLDELKIPRKAYRLVMLMPLVYVAWAHGRVQPSERKLIMGIAASTGCWNTAARKPSSAG